MEQIQNSQNLYDPQPGGAADKKSRRYSALAEELRQHSGWLVGVLWDEAYAGKETPAGLRLEHFQENWGKLPGVEIVPLDANQVHSYSILSRGKLDILVFPYGSLFPMDAFGFYSAQAFKYFLRGGGAVLTTGGIPFMQQAGPKGEVISIQTPEEMVAVYDKWVSKFGIKYYECLHPPSRQRANTELFPGLPEWLDLAPNRYGAVVNNSAHDPVPMPPHGNVFPERVPARQVIPLITGVDRYGQHVATSAVLVQDFMDGSRRVHFTHEQEPHPLSPGEPIFETMMLDLFTLLTNRVMAVEVAAEYACYRPGETVQLRGEIANLEANEHEVTAIVEVSAGEKLLFTQNAEFVVQAGQRSVCNLEWAPVAFSTDEYHVRLRVQRAGRTVSMAENGFIVWDGKSPAQGDSLSLRQHYFEIGGRGTFITGTNYYESTLGEIMWFRPNVANLVRDFRKMYTSGVNLIRPHYHHLKWFKDYLLFQHGKLLPFYQELEGLEDPMPDERGWRIWDVFIYLSLKYGIIYNGDLFTLVPEEMGDPRGWFGTVEAVYDQDKRPAQKAFLRLLEQRYREIPLISWDLFNEPVIPEQEVAAWASDLKEVFARLDSPRLITVGGPLDIAGVVDYGCPHGRISADFTNSLGKPVLLQELHLDRPEPLAEELAQAEDLRYYTVLALRNGLAGVCPWSWTRQMRLWQDTYEHHHTFPMEKWDDRLGLNTHEDGTLKAAGQVFKNLAMFLRDIDLVRYEADTKTIITSQGRLIARIAGDDGAIAPAIYHGNEEQCFAAMAQGEIAWDGQTLASNTGGAYLYFYTVGESSFPTAGELYFKSEGPGEIQVRRGGIKEIMLVDLLPSAVRELEPVTFVDTGEETRIPVEAEQTSYWFRIRFAC